MDVSQAGNYHAIMPGRIYFIVLIDTLLIPDSGSSEIAACPTRKSPEALVLLVLLQNCQLEPHKRRLFSMDCWNYFSACRFVTFVLITFLF